MKRHLQVCLTLGKQEKIRKLPELPLLTTGFNENTTSWWGSTCLSEAASRLPVLSGGGHRAFLLSEEASEQHDLTDADDKQQDGFSDGPVGHPLEEMLCFCAVMCLSQPVPCLRVSHHLQDLMNGDARGLQLKVKQSRQINQVHGDGLGHWIIFSNLLLNRFTSTSYTFP